MAKNEKKSDVRAAQIAALTAVLEDATRAHGGLVSNGEADPAAVAAAEEAVKAAQTALDEFLKANQEESNVRSVKFLLSPTGAFGLGYNEGEEAELEAKQASELVELGYAEYVK